MSEQKKCSHQPQDVRADILEGMLVNGVGIGLQIQWCLNCGAYRQHRTHHIQPEGIAHEFGDWREPEPAVAPEWRGK